MHAWPFVTVTDESADCEVCLQRVTEESTITTAPIVMTIKAGLIEPRRLPHRRHAACRVAACNRRCDQHRGLVKGGLVLISGRRLGV